jgi:hypothetical protein
MSRSAIIDQTDPIIASLLALAVQNEIKALELEAEARDDQALTLVSEQRGDRAPPIR